MHSSLYESCSASGLLRLPSEWPPRCYPLPWEPTIKSSQEDGHVLRRTILLAGGNHRGAEAPGSPVCDRAPAVERAARSPEARDGKTEGDRARAGNRLSG